jgi:hypothetical protein
MKRWPSFRVLLAAGAAALLATTVRVDAADEPGRL